MNNILKEVVKVAEIAGREILKIYNRNYKIYEKNDKSPVTEADLASDEIIASQLTKYKLPVLSEESKDKFKEFEESNKFWIVDSLDGTADFIQKTGEFSIMIGLVKGGRPILGVVYQPTKDKLYYAQKGKGSFLKKGNNIKKIRVSNTKSLDKGRLVVSRNHLGPDDRKLASKMGIKDLKQSGSNGIKMGLIAENKADLFFNLTNKMGKWDSCAPEIILEEAGGKVTNTVGMTIRYDNGDIKNKKGIVASNRFVHNQIIKNINI